MSKIAGTTIKRTVLEPVTQPLHKPAELPRCFLLSWNHSSAKSASASKYEMREAYGCRFPNGRIALDYKLGFDSMGDMVDHYAEFGEYSIAWLSGEDE